MSSLEWRRRRSGVGPLRLGGVAVKGSGTTNCTLSSLESVSDDARRPARGGDGGGSTRADSNVPPSRRPAELLAFTSTLSEPSSSTVERIAVSTAASAAWRW